MTKTEVMFVLNTRKIVFPNCAHIDGYLVKVVSEFNILSAIKDNKSLFKSFINNLEINANKKLFSIKDLIDYSFRVKIKFITFFLSAK